MTLGVPYLAAGGNAAAGPASTAFAVTHAVATGDCIAAWVTTNTGAITSVTDSQGNIYLPQDLVSTSSLRGQWWVSHNSHALTLSDTITVTPATSAASRTISAAGCPGAAVAAAVDYRSKTTASGSSAAPSVTSGGLIWKDEVSLAGLVTGNTGGAVTWTGTFAAAPVADTQHNGTTEYGAAAALVTHVSPWPSATTVTAAGTITSAGWAMSLITLRAQTSLVGASIGSPASFFPGTPTMNQAIASFDGWAGRKMAGAAVRAYYLPGNWPGSLSATWRGWITSGLKIVINFKPGGTAKTQSSAEATNLANAIKMWQNAGACYEVTLWHEPNQSGAFTPSQYASYVAYYGATVRGTSAEAVAAGIAPSSLGYIPILGTGGTATAYAMYPGDAVTDWIMCDFYGSAYQSGVRLNAAQSGDAHSIQWRADNHSPAPVPLGLGEWNAGAGTQITLAVWNAYVAHLTAVFSARALNCEMIFWMGNSAGCQDQIINGTDFKIPGPGPNACAIPSFSNGAGSGLQTFFDAVQPGLGAGSPAVTTTSPLPGGTVGSPYSVSLTASGGTPPYTWAVTTGALPAGLSLAANGTISGSPSAAGTSSAGFAVTDSLAATGTATLSLTIAGAGLTVAAQSFTASQGVPFAAQLNAAGGNLPYSWAVTAGSLPAGLALASSGLISGTPTGTGVSSPTVQVTDHLGVTATGTVTITVTVPAFTIATGSLPAGVLGQSYTGQVDTIGGTLPVTAWAVISGQLPPGLSIGALVATDPNLTDEAGSQVTDEAGSAITDESGP